MSIENINKNILILILILSTSSFFAQNAINQNDVNAKHKKTAQQISPINSGSSANKESELKQNKFENINENPLSHINEDDIYQGRKKEILNNLNVKEIPADFPKYEKGKGIIWYNGQMDDYYSNHPEILKDHVRKKFGL